MGTSYQEFRGRGFWTRDHTLCVWYAVLYEEATKDSDRPAWLNEVAETWRQQACWGAGGIWYAEPDDAWTDEQVEIVLGLARASVATLSAGGAFSGDELLRWTLEGEAVHGGDWRPDRELPREEIRQVGDGFARLLDGTFPPHPPFACAFLGTGRGWLWIGRTEPDAELDIPRREWQKLRDAAEQAGGTHWDRA